MLKKMLFKKLVSRKKDETPDKIEPVPRPRREPKHWTELHPPLPPIADRATQDKPRPRRGKSDRHKIIIGIDYGTTFSGVSYVTTDKNDEQDINIVSNWPGHLHTAWKTPTRIAYATENNAITCNTWGFEVQPKLKSYSWTKLLLDKYAPIGDHDDPALELANISGTGMLRLPAFRDAAGVCEDFLLELYVYVSAKLQQQMSKATFDITPMECWITLPAIWSEEAKDLTLRAAKNAGFGSRPGDEVFTIAEPEAAAVATLCRFMGNTVNAVKPNEHILICDCGGGTVDITTYKIVAVDPWLEFDELCIGVGGKCGSTYIDRNLHTLLFERFGDAFANVPNAQKGPGSKLMLCFEQLKQHFGLNDDRSERELSPINLNIPDSKYYDSDERMITLTYADMQSLFDPVISGITGLIGQQVRQVKAEKNATIDRIILVGGFGESAYLNKALREWCAGNGSINLMCPQNPQAAVVRGAALRGLLGIAPRMKRSRHHYGIRCALPFREGIDPENLAYIDNFTDSKYCERRMKWLISKGDEILLETYRTVDIDLEFTPGEAVSHGVSLYTCSLDVPPQHFSDSVVRVGSIGTTFDKDFIFDTAESRWNSTLKKTIHQFEYQAKIQFGNKSSNLTFSSLVNDQVVAKADIRFDAR